MENGSYAHLKPGRKDCQFIGARKGRLSQNRPFEDFYSNPVRRFCTIREMKNSNPPSSATALTETYSARAPKAAIIHPPTRPNSTPASELQTTLHSAWAVERRDSGAKVGA